MTQAKSRPIVELKEVTKEFQTGSGIFHRGTPTRAVDGVSLAIGAGEAVALVGESGSGKSTLANLILGLEKPTSGVIRAGECIVTGRRKQDLREVRKWLQPVFQDPSDTLNPRMLVGALIAEPLLLNIKTMSSQERDNRVASVLTEVGLEPSHARRFPHQLSGGQRQRVAIARALVLEPRVLILDEPVSALDVSISAQVLNLLKDVQSQREMAYLLIAHDLSTVSYIADVVFVMRRGRIVESGSAERVFGAPEHDYTRALLRASSSERLSDEDAALASVSDE